MPYKTGSWGIQAKERYAKRLAKQREYRKNNPLGKQVNKKNRSSFIKGQTVGNKNCNWHGGICRQGYPSDFNFALKDLIRKRDNYKCRICGCPQEECFKALDVHHKDFNKSNLNPDNLITLCRKCHTIENGRRQPNASAIEKSRRCPSKNRWNKGKGNHQRKGRGTDQTVASR